MRKSNWPIPAIIMLAANAPAAAVASEMVYHPVTPTFGGNPLNGSALLATAQAQGEGVKSGPQGPDLSGLSNALNNLGSGAVIVGGAGARRSRGGAGGRAAPHT